MGPASDKTNTGVTNEDSACGRVAVRPTAATGDAPDLANVLKTIKKLEATVNQPA